MFYFALKTITKKRAQKKTYKNVDYYLTFLSIFDEGERKFHI